MPERDASAVEVLSGRVDAAPGPWGLPDWRAHLCLDQPLGGDCAFDAFHCVALGDVIEGSGVRGYRSALLEAGTLMGRLQLAAYALGHSASGITFYEDEVSAFLETEASPMLVTTVGIASYRPRPGNRPAEMDRLPIQLT